jgi:hypothetical protein
MPLRGTDSSQCPIRRLLESLFGIGDDRVDCITQLVAQSWILHKPTPIQDCIYRVPELLRRFHSSNSSTLLAIRQDLQPHAASKRRDTMSIQLTTAD